MQGISKFHDRGKFNRRNLVGGLQQPLACFLASENGVFGCVAAGIGIVMRLDVRIAAVAAAMVWVCLTVSKVVSSFSALMRWRQTFLLGDSALRN